MSSRIKSSELSRYDRLSEEPSSLNSVTVNIRKGIINALGDHNTAGK